MKNASSLILQHRYGVISLGIPLTETQQLIDEALDCVGRGRPKEAFRHLYTAELVHRSPQNQPPHAMEAKQLAHAWAEFGKALPVQVVPRIGRL